MRVTKEKIAILVSLLISTFVFGRLSSYLMVGYNDCRYSCVFSFSVPCADDTRLLLSDASAYATLISTALCFVVPILMAIREGQRNRDVTRVSVIPD